jgi:hypothetical protein
MGVTFWGQFRIPHSVSSISLVRHVLCASVQPGRVAVRASWPPGGPQSVIEGPHRADMLQDWCNQ